MTKRIIISFVIISVSMGLLTAWYLFNKPHIDYVNTEAVASFEAKDFMIFISDMSELERGKLGNNVYKVKGKVISVTTTSCIISPGIVCQIDSTYSENIQLLQGTEVEIKGRYIAYDDLFSEVRLDHVVPI